MSFVREVEDVIDELSDWVVETVLELIDALMPDGKPFFREPKTVEEQLDDYYTVRGNPEAWAKWIAERTAELVLELQDSGVDPEAILSVHPVDLAQKAAVQWSADMEDLIGKGLNNGIPTGSREVAPTY